MARRSARPFLMGTPSFRRRGASRRATSGFSVPGAVLPGCDGIRAGSPIRAASAALRRRRVQPLKAAGRNAGGRLARASRVRGYESRPRAPHRRCRVTPISAPLRRLHHRDVSRRRPQSSRTRRMIRARERAGISFCLVGFQWLAWRRAKIFKILCSPGGVKRNPGLSYPHIAGARCGDGLSHIGRTAAGIIRVGRHVFISLFFQRLFDFLSLLRQRPQAADQNR